MITKVDLYNAPYEITSADRFYKDIDTKLVKHYKGNVKDFSHTITSPTSLTLTVNDEGIGKASYARLESSIFNDNRASYWFLTAISEIESDDGTRYTATLDAIATFGEEVFTRLQDKKIKIDRLHEDRFVYKGDFEMVHTGHSLINSDFKIENVKGTELIYDGSNLDDELTKILVDGYVKQNDSADEWIIEIEDATPKTYEIDNRIINGNKTYYLYALINFLGSPLIYDEPRRLFKNGLTYFPNDFLNKEKDALRQSVLIPINSKVGVNDMYTISRLQEGKVINIIKSPIKIDEGEGFQIIFDKDGKRYVQSIDEETQLSPQLFDESFDVVNLKNKLIYPDTKIIKKTDKNPDIIYEIIAYKNVKSYKDYEDLDFVRLDISELNKNSGSIMGFIKTKLTIAEMKYEINNNQGKNLEIGLLNSNITPIEISMKGTKTKIDPYNLFDNTQYFDSFSVNKFLINYSYNEMGIECTLEINKNQFIQWSENELLSFATDQGATYLARNKYSNDAQRKAIDLAAESSKNQLKIGQAQQYGGGIMGGALSLINPANWAAGIIRGNESSLQNDIAANKKSQIQATIDDASAASPSIHTGTTHNLADLNNIESKHVFNWSMKKAPKQILDKIIEFYDRHGYTIHDWLFFNEKMIESRSRFNYIQISEFKDFIGTFDDFDINVLTLIDKEFKKGLRLWHIDEIDYNLPNIEIEIEKYI